MSQPAMAPPEGVVADLQNPTDVIRTINFVTQALTLTFCSAFVLIRAVQKLRLSTSNLSVDDYLTLLSWVFLVAYCTAGVFLSVYGGGYHLWEVTADSFVQYMKAMYAATISYALMTLFIKLSILSLIARVFAPYKRRVQGIYALGALLTVYYITSLMLKIRVCWPISAYWRGDQDKCLNQSAVITADAIISTVTDAIILVLPLPLTWSLQLPPRKKMRVGSMLAVGGLATAFSAWRLHLIVTNGQSPDATILFVQVVLSGNAEAGIALICTCLPAAVGQFKFLRDRLGYSSAQRTNELLDNQYSVTKSAVASSAAHRNTVRKLYQSRPEASFDEMELVANAQRNSTSDQDTVRFSGIMRKVEVRSAVSYKSKDSDGESKETHESRQQIAH